MVLEDLKKLPLLQTRGVAEDTKDEKTHAYILNCLMRFFSGDYGEICEEDTQANNSDLEAGDGHILARYKGEGSLKGDIYIEAMFYSEKLEDINYSYIMIMYPEER